ncbi:MAG: hypothetical protein IJ498_00565, partial [Akkermansia sp.]|nr:hypothetical protein [Akkermansia sp.]
LLNREVQELLPYTSSAKYLSPGAQPCFHHRQRRLFTLSRRLSFHLWLRYPFGKVELCMRMAAVRIRMYVVGVLC